MRNRRLAQRRLRRGDSLEPAYVSKYREIDKFLLAFEEMWKEVYGEKIEVLYRHGWYCWGHFRYRRSMMEGLLQEMHRKSREVSDVD